ncbi:TonB-dependent receptor [Aquisalimonas lutea]|uniref:TonB-dependent receptor family protein n=1 Tax=Aquisalimonas lutea TaxID=1327750 RepID=UPI0025B3FA00|nr:TonB-dependent receptor [Aquisalimonas lutea]MDN3519461.1 TonB-dependent receptor [Aquisalimonas lutea]
MHVQPRIAVVLLVCPLLVAPAQARDANDGERIALPAIDVEAPPVIVGVPGFEDSRREVEATPGGAQAVPVSPGGTAAGTLADVLSLEPGVVVQEFFGGNDQPRVNIRGSGIQSNPQSRGVAFLRNGLPANLADGSYVVGLFDPEAADHIVVKRGANALSDGAATLGGSLNLVSPTGRSLHGGQAAIAGGDYGTRRVAVRAGGSRGRQDGLLRLGYSQRDGFRRENNRGERFTLGGNTGWRTAGGAETRVYAEATDLDFDVPGPLNAAQLESNPEQVNAGIQPPPPGPQTGSTSVGPDVLRDRPWRSAEAARLALTHDRPSGEGVLRAGAFYQKVDDVFGAPSSVRDSASDGAGAELEWQGRDLLLGVTLHAGRTDRVYRANERGEAGRAFAHNRLDAFNGTLYGQWRHGLTERLTLVLGAQALYTTREIDERFATPDARPRYNARTDGYTSFASGPVSLDRSYSAVNPKLGALFRASDTVTVFGNLSRSYEPPTFIELLANSGSTPDQGPNAVVAAPLDAQDAVTLEVGARGRAGDGEWSLAAYNTWVDSELLTSEALFGAVGITTNYGSPTIHRGVELGGRVPVAAALATEGDRLTLALAYEWSDFFFDGGRFEGNRIAGVPEHRLQGRLRYSHPTGAYLEPGVVWLPEDTPTDHANTVFQDDYALWSLRAGWQAGNWEAYIEGRNLTDETYAASYLIRERVPDPQPPNAGPAEVTSFIPGSGRSLFAGVRVSW